MGPTDSEDSSEMHPKIKRSGEVFIPRGQGFDATLAHFYETPLEDPNYLEIWCYTDKICYLPGEEVRFHASTTAKEFSIEVVRDGLAPRTVYAAHGLPGALHRLQPDFYSAGCGWPVACAWRLPSDLPSAFYTVVSRTTRTAVGTKSVSHPTAREQHHGFFVRRPAQRPSAEILLVAATCTWTAYNDWGGFSHYLGRDLPDGFRHAPRLSIQRPFARGFIWIPDGAPRKPHRLALAPNSIPVYPIIDFAYARGFSKFYGNAGWATYERNFALFAEREGYQIDYAAQSELHYDPHLLDGYKCVVFVGHCEYWTWEMRKAVERFLEGGGNIARFAGDFSWQIRLEDAGSTQIAYKERADDSDPVRNTVDRKHLLTSYWEHPAVNWFGAETFGLSSSYGVYAHVGVNTPRSTGGFAVYRPDHWAFAGTDLYYGDDFGSDAKIFGYEVDGLDYTFSDGLPYPTFKDRAPAGTEILAMSVASNCEADHGHRGSVFYYGDQSPEIDRRRYGAVGGLDRGGAQRGSGMIVTFQRGAGTVFHAGSCEWVAGLKCKDYCTETITRNVLNRFIGKN